MTKKLKHILSPLKIGPMELENRAVMPPMGTNLGNADGTVSEENLAYLKRRAKGGPGLIITEITGVHPTGFVTQNQIASYDDRFIPGLRKLAEAAHGEGCKIAMQIHHAGRETYYLLTKGIAMAPSPVPSIVFRMPPREMSTDDIKEIIQSFGSAAARAREAGFDAVEIHGAHGYLLTQFLSSLSNKREDEYGGTTLKERSRFVMEVIREVRQRVGPDFPISLRISAEEYIKGGYTADEIQKILPDMVKAGADIIHSSFGTHGSPAGITQAPPEYEPGFNVRLAKKVKEVVDVPVIAVGRFNEPALADEVISRGDADLVAFGRQFLADPDFLIKAKEGRPSDIRKCIACNQGCIEREMLGEGNIRCAINPETGQETVYPKGPAITSKDVWVIGAGPAGLIAACEAVRLGHNVTLFEKEDELGGQMRFGSIPPYKKIYGEWIRWQIGQTKKLRMNIKNNTEVTDSMIKEARPQHVILASGAERIMPDIPGIEKEHVCDAWQILEESVKPQKHVLVIGGGLIGMETADYLSDKGCDVTLVEILKRSPVLMITSHGYMLHTRLRDKKCRLLFSTRVISIGHDHVEIETEDQPSEISPIEQVVVAAGLKPRDDLKKALEDLKIPYTVIGDARSPRRIMEATEEGARAAWDL